MTISETLPHADPAPGARPPGPRRSAPRRSERQMRYLSQAAQLEEAVNPSIIRVTMGVVAFAILAFIAWAAVTDVHEVARTSGEVVPRGFTQRVQHLEGGIVRAIAVEEGALVRRGDVLLQLDDGAIREDLRGAESRQIALQVEAERLRAFVDGREPDFAGSEASAQMLADNAAFFIDMRAARAQETQVIEEQVEQRRRAMMSTTVELENARANLLLMQDLNERREQLNENGHASTMQLIEDRRRLNDARAEVRRLENDLEIGAREIAEFERRRDSLVAKQRDLANEQLFKVLTELDETRARVDKLKETMARLTVRAPTDGLVKGLAVNTIGAVVRPGDTLMEVVPVDHQLEVVVRIEPRDVGHLAVGQKVNVKVSSYDVSRYGPVPGELTQISATTFAEEDGKRYYQGRIRLDQNHVGDRAENVILPGMTVNADVITGEKTILAYLLRPIHASLQSSLTER